MSVTNVGSVNDGLPGDVVVGYFEQLKGLESAKSAEIFGDSTTAPTGFMVVNALTGQTRYPSYLLDPRTDNGSLAETAQDITLTVKKPNANAHLMLDQIDQGRTWATGPLEFPLGRGINFEVQVDNLDGTLQRITEAGWPIFVEPEEKWYRAGDIEIGVRQFLIQDPDGYLVRLQQEIGERPARRG